MTILARRTSFPDSNHYPMINLTLSTPLQNGHSTRVRASVGMSTYTSYAAGISS